MTVAESHGSPLRCTHMSTLPIAVILFIAGMLTILLPCILPLLPIVLGVSVAGRNPWRPLLTVLGMVISFVACTFLLTLVLNQFVTFADVLRIGTYYILLLFGVGFLTSNKTLQLLGAVLGGFFFNRYGWITVTVVQTIGAIAMELGSKIATKIQQFGGEIQQGAGDALGRESPIAAFIIGLTLGLVWVPCAGPALGFAFALVREEPGARAAFLLGMYGLGTAIPLLIVGYGGQVIAHRVRSLSRYSGRIKQVAGVVLILTALGLQYGWLMRVQTYLVQNTSYGTLGTEIEERLFAPEAEEPAGAQGNFSSAGLPASSSALSSQTVQRAVPSFAPKPSGLPSYGAAPEFAGLGPWHSSSPLTMEELKGKVVLIDFWTYSCINCIRTLPYIRVYWDAFKDTGKFVLIGVHTPEFVFEKDQKNVADAIKRHGLTYPIAQDNDFGTWNAFHNRYWPAKYLIDVEGNVRYTHFGEGGYRETEEAIRELLLEVGVTANDVKDAENSEDAGEYFGNQTPETYLGSRSWGSLGNGAAFPTDAVVTYEAPEALKLHKYALEGDWQMVGEEKQVLRSEAGEIRMKFLGGEINLVMGTENMKSKPSVEVLVDGKSTKAFTIDRYDLFDLWKGEYGEHEIVLKITGAGVEGYAFTFGQ